MNKKIRTIAMGLLLGLLAAGISAEAAKARTVRGKTKQGDKYMVELTNEGAKTAFLLRFTSMSEKLYAFFEKVNKNPRLELTLRFLNVEDSLITKTGCAVADFKFGAGGGLKYEGKIPCEQGCPSVKKIEIIYA